MENMEIIFDVVGRVLPAVGVEFLLIGGHAVNHYGYSRATIDVDFMIASSHADAVRTAMRSAGFTNISQTDNVVFFNHPAIPHRVDFLQVDAETLRSLVGRASRIEYGGQSLLVPSLPDLIAMKLFALKQGSAQREAKDFPDIVNLVLEHGLDIEAELEPLCEKYADQEIYSRLARKIREERNA